MDTLLSRITIDPSVCHGKPCIRDLRYPVETLLDLLSSGMTVDEIIDRELQLNPFFELGRSGLMPRVMGPGSSPGRPAEGSTVRI